MKINKPLLVISSFLFIITIATAQNNKCLKQCTFIERMKAAEEAISKQDWPLLHDHARILLLEEPDNIWVLYFYGLALTNMGQLPEGEKYLAAALKINPEHFWSNYLLFFNHLRQNKPSAVTLAAKVDKLLTPEIIKTNSADIKPFYSSYSALYERDGDRKNSRKVLQRALELFPKDPLFTSQLAYSYFRIDMKLWEKLSRESLNLVSPGERKALHVYQFPLRGNMIKVHQGNNETISHLGLINGYHFDFVMADDQGTYGKDETKKEGHYIFDQIVYAAADGVVYSVYDSSPDTEPMKNNSGYDSNIIVISHPDNEYSLYIHIKCKSALVKPGDIVKRGQPIAHVGSSGRFTDIPHLHFGVNRNGFSVETNLSGFELLKGKTWKNPGPCLLKKNDLIKTDWK